MLASRMLPGEAKPPCSSSGVCSKVTAHSRPHTRKTWRCNTVASESAALELDGTRSKVPDARSNIVPKASRRFPSRSDREDHSGTSLHRVLKKLPVTHYSALLSSAGKARSPGGLNTVLESYNEQPEDDRIPLHGGLPHPSAFPFAQLTVKLTSGTILTIDNPDLVRLSCQHGLDSGLQNHPHDSTWCRLQTHNSMPRTCWYVCQPMSIVLLQTVQSN